MSGRCLLGKVMAKIARAHFARRVIADRWPVKAAAAEIGMNRKTAEHHVAVLRRMIRESTKRWMAT